MDYKRTRSPGLLRRPRGLGPLSISKNAIATKTQPATFKWKRRMRFGTLGKSFCGRASPAVAGSAKRLRSRLTPPPDCPPRTCVGGRSTRSRQPKGSGQNSEGSCWKPSAKWNCRTQVHHQPEEGHAHQAARQNGQPQLPRSSYWIAAHHPVRNTPQHTSQRLIRLPNCGKPTLKNAFVVRQQFMVIAAPEFRPTERGWPDSRPHCNQGHADASRCLGL